MSNINNVFRATIIQELRAAIRKGQPIDVIADDDSPNATAVIIKLRLVHHIPADSREEASDHWRLEWVDRHWTRYKVSFAGLGQASQFDAAEQVVDYCLASVGDITRTMFSLDGVASKWVSRNAAGTVSE